jgi:hypothetical protein
VCECGKLMKLMLNGIYNRAKPLSRFRRAEGEEHKSSKGDFSPH